VGLNVSQYYGPPLPVTGIALPFYEHSIVFVEKYGVMMLAGLIWFRTGTSDFPCEHDNNHSSFISIRLRKIY
jgi:hypothetical protein